MQPQAKHINSIYECLRINNCNFNAMSNASIQFKFMPKTFKNFEIILVYKSIVIFIQN